MGFSLKTTSYEVGNTVRLEGTIEVAAFEIGVEFQGVWLIHLGVFQV